MNVLVTGASGFLGRHVVAALRDAGHTVRALSRSADARGLPGDVEVVRADLCESNENDDGDLERAFDVVDVLVHLAARVGGGSLEEHLRVGVGGTQRLLEAMAKSKQCRRIVLASSFSLYDVRKASGTLDERTPTEDADVAELDAYAQAKVRQEQLVRRYAKEHGWELVVLRPGLIWGKDHLDLHKLGRRVGPVMLIVAPSSPLPLTHVESAAAAFVRAAEGQGNETLNVVDGHDVTSWRFATKARVGTLRVPVPYVVGITAAKLARLVGGRRTPGVLQPRRFEAYYKPLRANNDAIRRALNWSPKYSFDEALKRSL
jgi:UDP-glucose 4-epimerase